MGSASQPRQRQSRLTSFPGWTVVLAWSRLPVEQRTRFSVEIARFLRYCQVLNTGVTAPRAREYLAIIPLPSARPVARQALRWFFQAARLAEKRSRRPAATRRPPRA